MKAFRALLISTVGVVVLSASGCASPPPPQVQVIPQPVAPQPVEVGGYHHPPSTEMIECPQCHAMVAVSSLHAHTEEVHGHGHTSNVR